MFLGGALRIRIGLFIVGTLFGQRRREQGRRNRDNAKTKYQDDECKRPTSNGDRVNVAVADGREGGNRPLHSSRMSAHYLRRDRDAAGVPPIGLSVSTEA